MKIVLECLLTLKAHFMPKVAIGSPKCTSPRSWGIDSSRWKQFDEQSGTSDSFGEELSPRKFQRGRSPMISGTLFLCLRIVHILLLRTPIHGICLLVLEV